MMRGQASLDVLLVIAIALPVMALFLSEMQKVGEASKYSLNLQNAGLILDRVFSAAERSLITGANETIEFSALDDFSFSKQNGSLIVEFEGWNGMARVEKKIGFDIELNEINISRGKNWLRIENNNGMLTIVSTRQA